MRDRKENAEVKAVITWTQDGRSELELRVNGGKVALHEDGQYKLTIDEEAGPLLNVVLKVDKVTVKSAVVEFSLPDDEDDYDLF